MVAAMVESEGIPVDLAAVDRLVDEYRTRCLWFLREGFYPRSTEERIAVLRLIERNADRDGFRRAAELRRWLSPSSNERSATS